jgi:hypothetical protein
MIYQKYYGSNQTENIMVVPWYVVDIAVLVIDLPQYTHIKYRHQYNYVWSYIIIYQLVTFWLVDIAIENGPFIDYSSIKSY